MIKQMNRPSIYKLKLLLATTFILACQSEENQDSNVQDQIDAFPCTALMTTRIHSFEALKQMVDIAYYSKDKAEVRITHSAGDMIVESVLTEGLNQDDYIKAKMGSSWDKFKLGLKSSYGIANREDLLKAYMLARRKYEVYGEGDVALFDLSVQMVRNISPVDRKQSSVRDLGEKGYLNTFNHFIAQSVYTSIFSEEMADFIADNHERSHLPALITGQFTEAQELDIDEGAVDNYVDIINNEWGQEYGKLLKIKYDISTSTQWTPTLLADYLNDIQDYFSVAFEIAFSPFRASDDVIIRFVDRTNLIMDDASLFLEDIWFLRRP